VFLVLNMRIIWVQTNLKYFAVELPSTRSATHGLLSELISSRELNEYFEELYLV